MKPWRAVLRLPVTLACEMKDAAKREGVSVNQFIVTCIALRLGELGKPIDSASISNLKRKEKST